MITVTKQENGVLFTFQDSDKYLYGSGTIEVPFNSLSIIQDESDNITLRKSASNDIFLSARYDTDFGYASKEAAVEALKGMLYEVGGGISEEEMKEMIDESISGKVDTSAITTAITSGSTDSEIPTAKATYDAIQAGGGGATYSAGTNISIDTANTINCTLPIVDWGNNNIAFTDKGYGNGSHTLSFGDGATTPSFYSMSLGNFTNARGNYSVAIGYGGRTNANFSNAFGYYTVTNNAKETAQGVYNNSVSSSSTFGDSGNTLFSVGNGTSTSARHNAFEIRQNGDIYIALNGQDVKLQDQLGGGAGLDDDTQQLISTAFNDLNDRKADLTELSKYQKKGDYVVTSTLADYMTNASFDEYATAKERIISGALNDLDNKFGGLRLVKISQTDYDNLTTKDENTLYIINNVI